MSKPNSKRPRLILVLSDIHAGSTVALMPPGFVTLEGNEIRQNPMQQWLWECWRRARDFAGEIIADDPFIAVLNGDMIDGVPRWAGQVISKETQDHVNCAAEVLQPAVGGAARIFMIRGTECHTNNQEVALGRILGAEINPESHPDPKRRIPAWDRLPLDIAGIRCMFRHHITTSMRSYTAATMYSVNITEEVFEAVRAGEPPPRVIERAHRHVFGHFTDGKHLCVVSAPWQMHTRYFHYAVPNARTRPGIHLLDWRNREDGELPELHFRTYDPPQPTAIAI